MDNNIPSPNDVQPLRDAVERAWKEVPTPDWSDFIVDDMDSEDIRRYFYQRRVENVDLFADSSIAQEHPLIYFKNDAALYYIKSYLYYILAIDRHLEGVSQCCLDTPAIHLIYYLCSKKPMSNYPKFTVKQFGCIAGILGLIAKHPEFYCCDSPEDIQRLQDGIIKWTHPSNAL